MTTALITHPDCLGHENLPGHPERPARLDAILSRLDTPAFSALLRSDAPLGTDDSVHLAHPRDYIDTIRRSVPVQGLVSLDADTQMGPGSLAAALRGVGAIVRAVDMVAGGEAGNAFCAIRPPGHHAETRKAMGFCLFGNAVIGARHAIATHGMERVAIVDFDVHHGNGTQDLVWDDDRILFASTHQMPLYPGSGHARETGAHGQVVNVPLAPGCNGTRFLGLLDDRILPRLREHSPELVIVSAGFDAHRADPLANIDLVEEDFAEATRRLCAIAEDHCGGRLVSTLEGGYDLEALAASVAAHVSVLMESGP
ncbi:MAG: histone deacetylase family protein [Paracoccaceae bacterium]|nr:histone deacetylase family protein [Paracoccaceae bacterium]